jgi:hypothetical protein
VKKTAVMAAVAFALSAAPVNAATWRQITAGNGGNTDQVALLRTADDVLHVAWVRHSAPNSDDLLHTAISAGGNVGATSPIQTGWAGIENPALVSGPGGIRAFFGGIRTTNFGETNQELNTALSPNGGASWALQIGSVVPGDAQAYGSSVSATSLPDGTPLEAWSGTLGTWVHSGLTPATPNHDYEGPLGHYGYDVGIASDPGGNAMIAWYSNATGHLGVWAQGVAHDGSPLGSATNMPATSNMAIGMIGRTPIVARAGGGFYVGYATGYPALNTIRLWRVGGPTKVIAKAGRIGNSTVTLAGDPSGRLWIAWTNTVGSSPHVFVRRSNRSSRIFGAVVDAGRARNGSSIYKLDASATRSALDLFANTSIGVSSTTSTWYTRVLPGLTLVATPARLHRGKATKVTFRVLDAGDPVAGARVRVGSQAGTTNAKGRVTLSIVGRSASVAARASAKGYVGAAARVRVLRR